MGMDAWLVAKTTKDLHLDNSKTGVCSGLFGITIVQNDEFELGYLRKGYDQNAVVFENCYKSDGDSVCWLNLDGLNNIIEETKRKLAETEFDEDNGDPDSAWYTWHSKEKYEDLVEMCTKAVAVLEQDPEAEIKFVLWY